MSTKPKVQMPSAITPMHHLIKDVGTGEVQGLDLSQDWASFFHSIQQIAFNATGYGTTANRPTNAVGGRYIGMPYFDTTLGYPVFLKSVNPDVWVDGAGTIR